MHQLIQLDQSAKAQHFSQQDFQLLRALIASYRELVTLLKDPNTSLVDVFEYCSIEPNEAASDGPARIRSHSKHQQPDQ